MDLKGIKHELISTDNGYELVLYLPDYSEEFGSDIDFNEIKSKSQKFKLSYYIKKLYPDLNIHAVRLMAGTVLAAVIVLPSHHQHKLHASPTEIVKSKDSVTLVLGNYYIKPDVSPFLYKDTVMIPLRAVSEVFGASVDFDAATKKVSLKKDSNEIKLWIGSKLALGNRKEYKLDVEPMIISGRTIVPLRFVAESFGIKVKWESKSKTVIIDYDKEFTLNYTIKPGDTLAKISKEFDVSVENLRLWNNIKDDIIYSGQFIRVSSPYLETILNSMDKIEIKEYDFDTVLGYTVKDYPTHTTSFTSLNKYYKRLTEVSTFTHKIDRNGNLITDYSQTDVVNFANNNNLKPLMLVHNSEANGFNKALVKEVLQSEAKRKALIDNIYSQLKKHGYSGVEIDFENVPPECKTNYSQFIKELSQKLKPNGFTVACAVPAKTGNSSESWLNGYDYSEIGKYADRVLIMSYDQHWPGGSPGPVASIEWVEKVCKYASETIDNTKILLGIPLYGYDWPIDGGTGKAVTMSAVNGYISTYGGKIEWDDYSKSPYYKYKDNKGKERIVWFENVQSAQFKFQLAKKYNFKGIGMWRLGLETSDFWTGLKSKSGN